MVNPNGTAVPKPARPAPVAPDDPLVGKANRKRICTFYLGWSLCHGDAG
jgi:hypothetical protein